MDGWMDVFEFLEKLEKLNATTKVRTADITTPGDRGSKPFEHATFRMSLTSMLKALGSL
jgi:hypothetical protein